MIKPASIECPWYVPATTAGMISSNGTSIAAKSWPRQSRRARYALVNLPGTAIVRSRKWSTVSGCRAATQRAVAVAHARAAGTEDVLVVQERVGVEADGGELQLGAERAAIERLDIDQFVGQLVVARVNLALGQRVKNEGIIRVRAVADADQLPGGGHAVSLDRRTAHRILAPRPVLRQSSGRATLVPA